MLTCLLFSIIFFVQWAGLLWPNMVRMVILSHYMTVYFTFRLISFKKGINHKQPLEAISKLNSCLADIRRWMITSKLKINDSKTEFYCV